MHEDLRRIVSENYAKQAAGSLFISYELTVTPHIVFAMFRSHCARTRLRIGSEFQVQRIAIDIFHLVSDVYLALTGHSLTFDTEISTGHHDVITDVVYLLGDTIKILWLNKSPKAFDTFIGQLDDPSNCASGLDCLSTGTAAYDGYKAILAKLSYHATDVVPQVRWAVVFSGLKYIVIYMPRFQGSPTLYHTPIMECCSYPNAAQHAPSTQPPIWSSLVYMLLTDALHIEDDALKCRLGIPTSPFPPDASPVPLGGVFSSNPGLARDHICIGLDAVCQVNKYQSYSRRLASAPGEMIVQCLDALPMALSFVGTSPSRSDDKQSPFIHLDHYLGGGWASVYASNSSRVVVKFASVPKKAKSELERQLMNEKVAYDRLTLLTGWVIPILYGEYLWYGGRSLVLSHEGPSLDALKMTFESLWLIERLVLFGQLYLIHRRGVYHCDFETRNVLRKGWCRLTIIDFAFSDVDHTCPGWMVCDELKDAWDSKLQLVGMLGKVRVRLVMGVRVIFGSLLFYTLFAWIIPSMVLCMVGLPADRIH